MSIEHDLPRLLDELAEDHNVGSPPLLEERDGQPARRARGRPALLTIAAVAASSFVLVGGLVAIGSRNDDSAPASPLPALTSSSTIGGATAPVGENEGAVSNLDLVRIDARTAAAGTTGVTLVFDGELPSRSAELLIDVDEPASDGIGYLTQASDDLSDDISVCGETHAFPPPGNRTVDIFVPGEWLDPSSPIDPPVVWEPKGATGAKIVVCEPRDGVVQVSVWGSASGRADDVVLRVDARTITVDIAPETAPVPETTGTMPTDSAAPPSTPVPEPVPLSCTGTELSCQPLDW